ncbi:MAG: glutamine amidotransferase [Gammaproteobacteria bacterium]|jgi:GMP synthase (glutamine-hydrolysing)|nr:glutamine amidotransferase [Gammaproteobacteria bacterium]MDG2338975.1 glutamine amidotransferase [Gammaproteobacteria bacterium]
MGNKILIIKTGTTIPSLQKQQEDFEDWFVRGSGLGANHFICSAVDLGETLPKIDQVAATIVTGSPAYVTDGAPWNEIAAKYLRVLHEKQKPILGVCYGHQLLAWAFGGEVGFHPHGREIGTVDVSLTACADFDVLFMQMPGNFKAQASHLQSVLSLPNEAVLLAQNEFEPNHAFRLGDSTWGVQFHPEFDARVMKAYISERKDDIEAEGLDAGLLLRAVSDTPISAGLLHRFIALTDVG